MSEVQIARASMAAFTPDRPMFVPRAVYAAASKRPELADLMDRIRVTPMLPSTTATGRLGA